MNPKLEKALATDRFWRDIGNDLLIIFLILEIILELYPEPRSEVSPWQGNERRLFARSKRMIWVLKRLWRSFNNTLDTFGKWLARHIPNKRNIALITALGVAIGVGLEIKFGKLADRVADKMSADRSLSKAEQDEIQERLKPFGSHMIIFFMVDDLDPEIIGIVRDLSKACALPGWYSGFDPSGVTKPLDGLEAPLRGILVLVSPRAPDKTTLPMAKTLVSLLQNDDLEVELSTAFIGPFPPIDNRVRIIVYSK